MQGLRRNEATGQSLGRAALAHWKSGKRGLGDGFRA